MSASTIQLLGSLVVAVLSGSIINALVDYVRNRKVGRLESTQFEFSTFKESNDLLRKDLAAVRLELAEERSRRRAVEAELAQAQARITALEARMSGQEKRS